MMLGMEMRKSKCRKLLDIIVVIILLFAFGLLKLYNNGYFFDKIDINEGSIFKVRTRQKSNSSATTAKPDLKIPWRFHIEDDGFVLPLNINRNKYITYEPINRSLTRQLLQFENAVVFAYVLKRTLLVPPVILLSHNKSRKVEIPMSVIVDFELLSSVVDLKEILTPITDGSYRSTDLNINSVYEICQDPRLGFWVDYIPSGENINAWRMLKQQHFSPLKLRIDYHNQTEYWCPGSEKYFDRWGPPLQVKALYRGILSELYNLQEDLILFQSSTLDTTETRFFNRKRVRNAQEILLFYIRFAKKITRITKEFSRFLGLGYTAVMVNGVQAENTQGLSSYLIDSLSKLDNASKTLFIVTNPNIPKTVFRPLRQRGYHLVFSDIFTQYGYLKHKEKELFHIYSLLLCAYAKNFIGLPGTSDLYFVQHLRLQDVKVKDGLVSNRINVKWAKHTVKRKTDDKKVLKLKPSIKLNSTSINTNETVSTKKPASTAKLKQQLTKEKRLNLIACTFCNYIRYVTGKDGCPAMKKICEKNTIVK